MIQVDLEVKMKIWYDIGYKGLDWTDAQYSELKALDRYQRDQVIQAHAKGINDRFDFPVI